MYGRIRPKIILSQVQKKIHNLKKSFTRLVGHTKTAEKKGAEDGHRMEVRWVEVGVRGVG